MFGADLRGWGFEPNPYNPCVMNKIINDKQCSILWHVDDLKLSHVDNMVTKVLHMIDKTYCKQAPITTTQEKLHDYLGMVIDYLEDGCVEFTMPNYIYETLDDLPKEKSKWEAETSAVDHLFSVANKATVLDEHKAKLFHQVTAKLLFLSKRTRPDIQLAVVFLCMRAQKPDEDDWKKLGCVLKYLWGSPGVPLLLSIDDKRIIQ